MPRKPPLPPAKNDNRAPGVRLGADERSYIFAVAMKYLKDEEAAADVTQDALLLAHRHRSSFRGDSKVTTWLYRIAATSALMYLRKRKRRAREILMTPALPAQDNTAGLDERNLAQSPEATIVARQQLSEVQTELERLGDKYIDIFWMRFRDGYTESEIARQLDLKLTTVKTRAYRARVAVREKLGTTERITL